MSRLGPMAYDVPYILLTYRDNSRIHQVRDLNRNDPRLNALKGQLLTIARAGRYLRA